MISTPEGRRERIARNNERTPPFAFRFANPRIKRALERMARKNHRTIAGELNALCERAAAMERTA